MLLKTRIHVSVLAVIATLWTQATTAAEVHVVNPSTGPDIYVSWNQGPDPVLNDDFTVSFSDAANPNVELQTGDVVWNVRSENDDQTPGNIGTISLNPVSQTVDFDLTIKNGTDAGGKPLPGAASVGLITLTASSWSGGSNLGDGRITGSLTAGLTLVKDSSGNEGELSGLFVIDTDASGDITLPILTGELRIAGNLSADISVSDRIDAGKLTVLGSVGSTASIQVHDMSGDVDLVFGEFPGSSDEFAGDLLLETGIEAEAAVAINGPLASTGSVDLNGQNLAGGLILSGGGSGSIVNGGSVQDMVQLADRIGTGFAGSATFAAVSAFGTIDTEGAGLAGVVTVTGDVDGDIVVRAESGGGPPPDLLAGGKIRVGGALDGMVNVDGSVEGDIEIVGSASGELSVGRKLKSTARILIDGLYSGVVTVGENTESLSVIRMTEGLGENGSITINGSGGDFDAGGIIHIGTANRTPPLDPVAFDGSILIKDDGSGNGGDLTGAIQVVGCHSNDDPLDICLCGGDGGSNISLVQTGCGATQAEGWSCVSGCP